MLRSNTSYEVFSSGCGRLPCVFMTAAQFKFLGKGGLVELCEGERATASREMPHGGTIVRLCRSQSALDGEA